MKTKFQFQFDFQSLIVFFIAILTIVIFFLFWNASIIFTNNETLYWCLTSLGSIVIFGTFTIQYYTSQKQQVERVFTQLLKTNKDNIRELRMVDPFSDEKTQKILKDNKVLKNIFHQYSFLSRLLQSVIEEELKPNENQSKEDKIISFLHRLNYPNYFKEWAICSPCKVSSQNTTKKYDKSDSYCSLQKVTPPKVNNTRHYLTRKERKKAKQPFCHKDWCYFQKEFNKWHTCELHKAQSQNCIPIYEKRCPQNFEPCCNQNKYPCDKLKNDPAQFVNCIYYTPKFDLFKNKKQREEKRQVCAKKLLSLIINDICFTTVLIGTEKYCREDLLNCFESYNPDIINEYISRFEKIKTKPFIKENFNDIYFSENMDELLEFWNSLSSTKNQYSKINYNDTSEELMHLFRDNRSKISHYYNSMHKIVDYIDKQNWTILSPKEKRHYIEILKAELSDMEQALLFVFSLTPSGCRWEYGQYNLDGYISKYGLIDAIPKHQIPLLEPRKFYNKFRYKWEEREELVQGYMQKWFLEPWWKRWTNNQWIKDVLESLRPKRRFQ